MSTRLPARFNSRVNHKVNRNPLYFGRLRCRRVDAAAKSNGAGL